MIVTQNYINKKEIKHVILKKKSGKKLSEKLLCVLLIHLTELQRSAQEAFRKAALVEFAK